VVPLRFLAETFGAQVEWLQKEEEIQIRFKDMLIHLWLKRSYGRSYDALIEKPNETPEKITLDTPPCSMNGRTMVPLRFIGETFGAKVEWDATSQIIVLRGLCDLICTVYSVKDFTVVEGEDFWINQTMKNNGLICSIPCTCAEYISLDKEYSSDDICVGEFEIPALLVDEEMSFMISFPFPVLDSEEETYEVYKITRIDIFNEVEELKKFYYFGTKSIKVVKAKK